MNEKRMLKIDTILWCAWKKKSEAYKRKVEKDLMEFGKLGTLCRWWKRESKGN